jgi:Tfp pilus assembly protein PilN
MLVRDPFDIAPAAQRPTRAAWLLLAVAVVFAVAAGLVLARSVTELKQARDAAQAGAEAARAQQRLEAAALQRASDPAALETSRARAQLTRSLRDRSWDELFGALERAGSSVDGRVSITSLSSNREQDGAPVIKLSGLSANNESLLQYVDALQSDRSIRSATLTSQEPVQNPAIATALRFHMLVVWEPNQPAGATFSGVVR